MGFAFGLETEVMMGLFDRLVGNRDQIARKRQTKGFGNSHIADIE
jgi:hypothetical protein